MSRIRFSLVKVCLVPALLFGCLIVPADADEAAPSKKAIKVLGIRAERPDDTRGWFVVTKESYWPLCFESMDRIEEARKLIGSGDHERLADALEKCGAWLKLAASAAMTDGKSGVSSASQAFQDAADSLRDGSSDWGDEEISNLTTLGLVVMAKSHVRRADEADQNFRATRTPRTPPTKSGELKAAARDIASENADRAYAQYRYDTIESQRHLTVAQAYLEAAAKAGKFRVAKELTAPTPELKAETPHDTREYVDVELRPRIASMSRFATEIQRDLTKKLGERI